MHLRRRIFLAVAVALTATACGTATPTPVAAPSPSISAATPSPSAGAPSPAGSATPGGGSPNPADQAVYAQIETQVQGLRGLTETTPVKPVLLGSQGVADWLGKANEAQTDHQALADESRLFIHLGLIPPGSSLEQMELALEAGQVVGFYDPTSKGLYILSSSGGVGGMEKVTFSHEYTHALQDQNFGLDKLATDTVDQNDRDLAHLSVAEGDATIVMTQWSTKFMSLADLLQVAGGSLSGSQTDQLAKAPPILSKTLLFPYQEGLAFVQSIYDKGGWAAVNKLYSDPPDSTSQILHPDLYANRVKPVVLTLPAVPPSLSGWKLTMQDTLGEFDLRIWLQGGGSGSGAAATVPDAAVGSWAGDRVGLYEAPDGGWAAVIHTAWRSGTGRDAFYQAANKTLDALGRPHRVCGDATHVDIAIASSESLAPEFVVCKTIG